VTRRAGTVGGGFLGGDRGGLGRCQSRVDAPGMVR